MNGITTEDIGSPFELRFDLNHMTEIYILTESGCGDGSGNDVSFEEYSTYAYTTKQKAVDALATYLEDYYYNEDWRNDIWDTEYWSGSESEEEEDGAPDRNKTKRAYNRQAEYHVSQRKPLILNSDYSHKITISIVKLNCIIKNQ